MSNQEWNSNNIPDQSGKTVIVTGANSGIGYEAARVLADKGALVILACRSMEKAAKAAGEIRDVHAHAKVEVMALDLSSLQSVRDFAGAFKKKYKSLDMLINNAGVMVPPYTRTADGFELQFGTNHLGHFALTGLLLESLHATNKARVVNVSSMAHKGGNINFDDLAWEKRGYKPWNAYGDSKIANLYFTYELQRKLSEAGSHIVVTAAHPGWTATNLQKNSGAANFFNSIFAQDMQMGALPTLMAAVDAEPGDYIGPSGFMEMRGYPRKVDSNARSRDAEIAAKLWKVSGELTGVEYELKAKAAV